MISCLAFDLDDTLYPEREYVIPGLAAAARRLVQRLGPVGDFEAEFVRFWEADECGPTFETVLGRLGVRADRRLIDEMVRAYRDREVAISPYGDVREAMDFWRARVPLALITDGRPAGQKKKVAALGLAEYFQEVVYTAELGPGCAKPDVAAFRWVQKRIGCAGPGVYIGDDPRRDVPGCRQAGWFAVRIARPGARLARLPAPPLSRPDYVISNLEELKELGALRELALQEVIGQ
jgi:putative hydrolase of the HAD superfamily